MNKDTFINYINDIMLVKNLDDNLFFKNLNSIVSHKLLDSQIHYLHFLNNLNNLLLKNCIKSNNYEKKYDILKIINKVFSINYENNYYKYLQKLGYQGNIISILNNNFTNNSLDNFINSLNIINEKYSYYEMCLILGTIFYLINKSNKYFINYLNKHKLDNLYFEDNLIFYDLFEISLKDKSILYIEKKDLIEYIYMGYKIFYDYYDNLYSEYYKHLK